MEHPTPNETDSDRLSLLELSGALSSRLIHDLSNQISIIVGNAEFASRMAGDAEPLQKTIQALRTSSNAVGKLIGQYGQLRRRLSAECTECEIAGLARRIAAGATNATGWRVTVPPGLTGVVSAQPRWLAGTVWQIAIDSQARAGSIDFACGPVMPPLRWRGTPSPTRVFHIVLRYRSDQPLFNEEGPAYADRPGLLAAWELVRCFKGQIHQRAPGAGQQEVVLLIPLVG